jgi:beta-mannosidase
MNRQHILDAGWRFKACDEQDWLPASIPGCVHTDLLRSGKIADPFYGTNEKELQWIDKKDWEYETRFSISDALVQESQAELVFDGLDTYADVYLNEELILAADNMFRTWRVDVKKWLQAADNVLRIRFRSPIQVDVPKLEQLGYNLPAPNDSSEIGGLGDKKISIFARKAPYHYGWDWGPRFVTSGIWREVRLECWSETRLTDVFIRQDHITTELAKLTALVEIECESETSGSLRIATDQHEWLQSVELEAGNQTIELELEIVNPQLWWSRGLGEPNRYEFLVELEVEDSSNHTHTAKKLVKTGLRSVEWHTTPDKQGATFHLVLNGVPVFCKGANHIPNDSFMTEMTRERYRHEIASAAESNMNMLRVWGGGVYEQEDFYDLCDEYGILVWQDFMFACSLYPGDDAFLNSVAIEAEDNIKRLRNHPSIALWCGNNEIDSAWAHYDEHAGWGWKKAFDANMRKKIWRDYEEVFHSILPDAVDAFSPGAFYWPSSPLSALTGDRYQHASPSATSGDIHYWGVWHATEPFENYNRYVGRFMSEYGFQSFPEPRTVSTYAKEADMALESDVMLSHQKNGRGNQLIKDYMDMYMQEPKDFPSFLHMSQVLQAEGIRQAIEAHRRNKPYCMGTLYWQMNDCWPVASWSSMDYYGRWKALQYTVRRSFRDVSLSLHEAGGKLDFYVISDLGKPLDEVKLRIRILDFDGKLYTDEWNTIAAAAHSASAVYSIIPEAYLQAVDTEYERVVLCAELLINGLVVDEKTFYFVPEVKQSLEVPAIVVREEPISSGGSTLTLSTDKLAKQVCVTSELEGIFSDNYFDLIPGLPKTIQFFSRTQSIEQPAFVQASPGPIHISSMAEWIKRA